MLMGCILFTVTEDSFGSLKSWLRLRRPGEGWWRAVCWEGVTQASAGREEGWPAPPETRPQEAARPRGLGFRTGVASNEGAENPSSEKRTACHNTPGARSDVLAGGGHL